MRVAGAAGEIEEDTHHAPAEWLGLFEPVGVLEQSGQVVERGGDLGVQGAIVRFANGERPAQEGLRGGELRLGMQGQEAQEKTLGCTEGFECTLPDGRDR